MEGQIVKTPMSRADLKQVAASRFGDLVKAVVDIEQGIMAVGAELHADLESLLSEREGSKREFIWGINLYPDQTGDQFIEFDSLVNLKPAYGNRTRGVDDEATRKKIEAIVSKLVI